MISKIMTLALAPIAMAKRSEEVYNIEDANLPSHKGLDLSYGSGEVLLIIDNLQDVGGCYAIDD